MAEQLWETSNGRRPKVGKDGLTKGQRMARKKIADDAAKKDHYGVVGRKQQVSRRRTEQDRIAKELTGV